MVQRGRDGDLAVDGASRSPSLLRFQPRFSLHLMGSGVEQQGSMSIGSKGNLRFTTARLAPVHRRASLA